MTHHFVRWVAFLTLVLALSRSAHAGKILIPGDETEFDPAIAALVDGDTIIVTDDGTYSPFTLNKDLLIYPTSGQSPTIQAGTTGHAAVVTKGTVRGLRFVGNAGVVVVNAAGAEAVFDSCLFEKGANGFGGIGTSCCKLTVKNSVFSGFESDYAITAVPSGQSLRPLDLEEEESYLCEESGTYLRVEDCRIEGGTVEAFDVLDVDILRNTFDGMGESGATALRTIFSASPDVQRNVFVDWADVLDLGTGCPAQTLQYNLFFGNTSIGCSYDTTLNKAWDPLFCRSRESLVGEYTVRIDSPTIVGQNPWGVSVGATDGVECAWGFLARSTTVAADAEVVVLEDLNIPASKTLTLSEGVEFRVDDDDDSMGGLDTDLIELRVGGTLDVNGTSGNRVKFVSRLGSPTEHDWYGIINYTSGTFDNVIKIDYAEVKHSEYGVYPVTPASGSFIRNSVFANNEEYDIIAGTGTSSLTLEIKNNTITVGDGIGIEIQTLANSAEILDNTITCNSSSVAGIKVGHLGGTSTPLFSGNTVTGASNGSGLHVAGSNPTVVENTFSGGNKYGIQVTAGTPLIGLATDSNSDNSITGNTSGIYVTGSGAAPKIRNNRIGPSNTYGVNKKSTSSPDVGLTTEDGDNNLSGNSTYCIFNQTGVAVPAAGNYFGDCDGNGDPAVCWSGSILLGTPLCTAPAGHFMATEPVPPPVNERLSFRAIHPNPAVDGAVVSFSLGAEDHRVVATVFDVSGRRMTTLLDANLSAGSYSSHWNLTDEQGSRVPSGLYFVRITTSQGATRTAKLLVSR